MTEAATTRTGARRTFGIAVVASLLYALGGTFFVPLLAPDEIRVAEIGREMGATGDFLVPRLGGEPFLEQPPLYYAAVATSFSIFGVSDGTARIPTMLATVATLLLAFDMGRRLAAAQEPVAAPAAGHGTAAFAGLLALMVLATLSGFFRYSHRCMVDIGLALFVTLGYWAWLRALLAAPSRSAPPAALVLLLYAAATLGFLVKGPVAFVLLFGPLAVDMLLGRRWWLLRSRAHLVGAPLMLVGIGLWPWLLLTHAGRETFDGFVMSNIVGRITADETYSGGHRNPPWYYLKSGPSMLLPWVLALPALAAWRWRAWRAARVRPSAPAAAVVAASTSAPAPTTLDTVTSMALIFPTGLLLLSLPATKRELYLLPLFVPLAVALAAWVRSTTAGGSLLGPRITCALFGLAVVAQFGLPLLPDRDRDMRSLATGLRDMQLLDSNLAAWRLDERSRAVIPFHTGHIVNNLKTEAEMEAFLAAHPGPRLLIGENRLTYLPAGLEPRLRLLQRWVFGDNVYAVYAVAATADTRADAAAPAVER